MAHLWLAFNLLNITKNIFYIGMLIAIIEIVIIVYKFILFFMNPSWNIWDTNWFINKIFVLSIFIVIFGLLLKDRKRILG